MRRALFFVAALSVCGCEAIVGSDEPVYVPPDAGADGDAVADGEGVGSQPPCEPCPVGEVACALRCKDASRP